MSKNILILKSTYHPEVCDRLLAGALEVLLHTGGFAPEQIECIDAPGAFELPLLALAGAKNPRYLGVICLGCVIQGETPHFQFVCNEVARGIMTAGLETQKPVIFGILTTHTLAQAQARSQPTAGRRHQGPTATAGELATVPGKIPVSNKGVEAAHALLAALAALSRLRS